MSPRKGASELEHCQDWAGCKTLDFVDGDSVIVTLMKMIHDGMADYEEDNIDGDVIDDVVDVKDEAVDGEDDDDDGKVTIWWVGAP